MLILLSWIIIKKVIIINKFIYKWVLYPLNLMLFNCFFYKEGTTNIIHNHVEHVKIGPQKLIRHFEIK